MILIKNKLWYVYGKTCTKYLHRTWPLLNVLMIFGIKYKCIILTHSVLLAIATNIPQRLMTGFVLQGHKYRFKCHKAFIYNIIYFLLEWNINKTCSWDFHISLASLLTLNDWTRVGHQIWLFTAIKWQYFWHDQKNHRAVRHRHSASKQK